MIIGITGSIATGKTLVTNYLREKGYKVIDADEISRAVLNKGEKGYDEVLKYFSENHFHWWGEKASFRKNYSSFSY